MNKYLIIFFLLFSAKGIGQIKLDTFKFKVETISINALETKFILTNNQELKTERIQKKRYYSLETYSKIESFSLNQNGELIDTFIRVQKFGNLDSTYILLANQKMKLLKRFGKGKLGLVVNFEEKEKNYTFFENSKISLSGIAKFINGEIKTKEINYIDGKRHTVTDNFLNRDTIYYDNGNLRMTNDNVLISEKKYNEKDGTLERHEYRQEIKNSFPNYETVIIYYLKNKISEKKILNSENQTTTFRYKNGVSFEKEIATVANNGDRYIELFDMKGKKIKSYTDKSNVFAPAVPDQN